MAKIRFKTKADAIAYGDKHYFYYEIVETI